MQRSTPPGRLPDVIGIGPPRTGSTWLYNALRDSVDMPEGVKDTHFLDYFTDKSVDWYAYHFRHATGEKKIVEICPGVFFHQHARELIKREIPNCRVVATMRDPVDRTYSAYKLLRNYGWVRSGTFDEIINSWPQLGERQSVCGVSRILVRELRPRKRAGHDV